MSDQFAPRSVLDELRDELGVQFAALPAPRTVRRAPLGRRLAIAAVALALLIAGGALGRDVISDSYPISVDGISVELQSGPGGGLSPEDAAKLSHRPLETQVLDPQRQVSVNGVGFTCPIPQEALDLIGKDPCQDAKPAPAPLSESGG
jgi:hypothetical protein